MPEKVDLAGLVAVVTGAGRGIGRAHALDLAARGAYVVVNDYAPSDEDSPPSDGEHVVTEIKAAGGEAIFVNASVATQAGGEAIIQAALDAYETVDVVVNNAGITRDRSFAKKELNEAELVIATHLNAAFNVTRPAWDIMVAKQFGRVIVTGSASMGGSFGQLDYGSAKAGLWGFMRTLAIEGQKYGITVNGVAPLAKTEMTNASHTFDGVDQDVDPADISAVIGWLSSPLCTTTGEMIGCGNGHMYSYQMCVTRGVNPMVGTGRVLTAEAVRDNLAAALDFGGEAGELIVLGSMPEELERMKKVWALYDREPLT